MADFYQSVLNDHDLSAALKEMNDRIEKLHELVIENELLGGKPEQQGIYKISIEEYLECQTKL